MQVMKFDKNNRKNINIHKIINVYNCVVNMVVTVNKWI